MTSVRDTIYDTTNNTLLLTLHFQSSSYRYMKLFRSFDNLQLSIVFKYLITKIRIQRYPSISKNEIGSTIDLLANMKIINFSLKYMKQIWTKLNHTFLISRGFHYTTEYEYRVSIKRFDRVRTNIDRSRIIWSWNSMSTIFDHPKSTSYNLKVM